MATLEEVFASYFDRLADRVADRIMAKLAAARPVTTAAPSPVEAARAQAPADVIAAVDAMRPPAGGGHERRAVLPQQNFDRPMPGSGASFHPSMVAPPQPVVDAPPQPPPPPPEDRRPVVLGAQLGPQPAPLPAPERTA